jgi:NAD(P)-dependent dehydrogenase (short-subunit alcohol dehydrogenase family)
VSERAALITGGSSGIGLAIARALGAEGYDLTVSGRRPEKLEQAAQGLRDEGYEVLAVPANVAEEDALLALAQAHGDRYGRLDVLVNNAGVGIGAPIGDTQTKYLDLQLAVNVRAIVLLTRECLPLLKQAGAEHGKALIVNTSSISGKVPVGFLGIYSASKHAVVGLSGALHKEHQNDGIQVTALCPAFVDTEMTDFVQGEIPPEQMIKPTDIAAAVVYLLHTSSACIVPEIQFLRRGDTLP